MCFREMLISQPTGGSFYGWENEYSPQKLGGEPSQALQSKRKETETSAPVQAQKTDAAPAGWGAARCSHPAVTISLKTRSGPKALPFLPLLLSVVLSLSLLKRRRAGPNVGLRRLAVRVSSTPDSWSSGGVRWESGKARR